MSKHVAISVLGKDRPGIVASIAKELFTLGCNIEDSSMTLLRSEFAMILIVDLPPDVSAARLTETLVPAGKKQGLSVLIREISPKEEAKERSDGQVYAIAVYGADRPGIVYKVSKALADHRISISDVQTSISRRAKKTSYVMLLEAAIPDKARLASLKKKLASIARTLKVTVTIHPLDTARI